MALRTVAKRLLRGRTGPASSTEVPLFGGRYLKAAARRAIARHRRSPFVRGLHRAARFVESAWHNEGADFASNGERHVLEALRPAGFRVALDVGANLGSWTGAALRLWPECIIHALEVAPATVDALTAAMAAHEHSNRMRVHPIGLSDREGEQTIYYYPESPELTSDAPRHEGKAQSVPITARFSTLDRFCRDQGIGHVDYLKIDVEGAEHRVLKGGAGLLAAGKIACIQFEYGAFSIDSHFLLQDYFRLLERQFHIGKIYPTDVTFAPYDWRAEDFRFCNYLCIARDRPDLLRLAAGRGGA